MRCIRCGGDNPDGAKFCIACASPLGRRCARCGVENVARARFCAECGASLASGPGPASDTGREGERRQLTVMFCDLVGSTALSQRLDPEEWRAVVRDYQANCAAVIRRFDGTVAQYLGDGLLVYFGYPQAHEDDAQRAVRAALDIVTALRSTPSAPGREAASVQVRVGIHTGIVVVGEIGADGKVEQLALGETPNIAARLQSLAEANSVVISAATERLVAGLFEHEDLGVHAVKGLSAPLHVYRVQGLSGVRSRLEALNAAGFTPLVGRQEEVIFLRRRWEQVAAGEGQVVLLGGEPGIGKSRLVRVLMDGLAGGEHVRIEWRCSPYHQNSAFYPLIEQLQRHLRLDTDGGSEEKLGKLETLLEAHDLVLAEAVPLFAALLSLPLPGRYPSLALAPQRQKQRTLETVVEWLRNESERQPTLLVVEDLHWVDPSTLELLGMLVEQLAPSSRLLRLFTFRPDFRPPWPMLSHVTQLTLRRLAREQIEVMVEAIAGARALPANVLRQVVAKTDGVPLFVEEFTKAVMESGVPHAGAASSPSRAADTAIPASLHDSLMARLDRLATGKEVAQLAATVGREFDYELIRAVSTMGEATLQEGLTRLVDAELLYPRGLPPQARYSFKHALIQDVAYQSLLKSKRQEFHRQIAQALEAHLPETRETEPELLAHHYTEAGLAEEAVPYWQAAGERGIQRSANVEAISHLSRGLELLSTLPETPERDQRELALSISLGVALRATKGFAAPEVDTAYSRALALCQRIGESPHLVAVLRGLWELRELRADYETAHALGRQLLGLAERDQDADRLLAAHDVMGDTLFWLGEFSASRMHLEQGYSRYDVRRHATHVFRYGYDLGVACLAFGAWDLWFLGYPDQALARAGTALALARELAHPFTYALALQFAGQVHHYRGEPEPAQRMTAEVITLATEQEFAIWAGMGEIIHGWARAGLGEAAEGIAQIRDGLTGWRAMGHELERPHFVGLLAEAHAQAGEPEEALTLVDDALATTAKTGEHFWEAELHRLRGELSCRLAGAHGDRASAEASFEKAIEISRAQSAKSLELRAVMALCRLKRDAGHEADARRMLAQVHSWFTEGFDTVDLREASALLEELS